MLNRIILRNFNPPQIFDFQNIILNSYFLYHEEKTKITQHDFISIH